MLLLGQLLLADAVFVAILLMTIRALLRAAPATKD